MDMTETKKIQKTAAFGKGNNQGGQNERKC